MLDEIYYTFKLSELLMVESDLEEYIANNPSVYDPRKVIYSGAEAMNKFIEDKINIFDNTK